MRGLFVACAGYGCLQLVRQTGWPWRQTKPLPHDRQVECIDDAVAVVIGADVVEVSPAYDGPGNITAALANRVVLEILNGMAEQRLG